MKDEHTLEPVLSSAMAGAPSAREALLAQLHPCLPLLAAGRT